MKRWAKRSTVLPAPIILAGLLVSVVAVFISGCGFFSSVRRENKQLYEGLDDSKGSLVKTMVVLPFENDVQWSGADLEGPFLKNLKSDIERKCSHVRVFLPDSPGFPDQFRQFERKENGEIDNYALALTGRASGINMVLAGRLVSINYSSEHRGMLWWARTHHTARIQMEVVVFHTGTGAKLLDDSIVKNIEIQESLGQRIKAREKLEAALLTDTLSEISETIGEMGSYVFRFIPWEGYVTSVDKDRIVLSSGESCGLKKGKVLDILSADKVTRGKGGHRFFMEGSKIGRITLTAVYPDHSEAVLKEGGPIPPGSAARLP